MQPFSFILAISTERGFIMKFPIVARTNYKQVKFDIVVVFINQNTGIVVKSDDSIYKVGEIKDTFTNVDCDNVWTILSEAESAFYIKVANTLFEKLKHQVSTFESSFKEVN